MKEQTVSLKGIKVVITGSGRGLGAAISIKLADLGCNVILCGRSAEALDNTADHIENRTGRRSQKFILDLADVESVDTAAQKIVNGNPVVDVLINNGAMWAEQKQEAYKSSEVLSVVNSAITGTFLFTQALLPVLKKSKRPDIVTIGSISGLPNAALHNVSVAFYAAKHGQIAVADGLRQILLGTPIRSICIHPPWLNDISPLNQEWNLTQDMVKGDPATNRDIVEAVIFAITRPRNITIASMVIDSDSNGMDFRSHNKT